MARSTPRARAEWTMFPPKVQTVSQYTELLGRHFRAPGQLEAALAIYPATTDAEVDAALGKISNDLWYFMGSWAMADLLVTAAEPPDVFTYLVTEPGFTEHGRDTPLWNGVRGPGDKHPIPAASPSPGACMQYLVNFARHGDPNGSPSSSAPLPYWAKHAVGATAHMVLGPTVGMHPRPSEWHQRFALMGDFIKGS